MIDVRSPAEFTTAHLKNAINIPLISILKNPYAVSERRDRMLLLYCSDGYQSDMAAQCLKDAGYEKVYGEATPEVVTDALMIMPIIGAIFTLAKGFISDKFGRKPVALLYAVLAATGMIGFFLGVTLTWSPVLVGLFIGIYTGGYWCAADAMGGNMCAESSPTNLRASILGAQSLCNMVGMGVSYPAMIVMSIVAGNDALGITCLACVAIPLVIAIAVFMTKVAETKGIDLNTVRGDEWD